MKKPSLPEALMGLLVLFALTTPIFAGTITDTTLSLSSLITNTNVTAPTVETNSTQPIPGRNTNANGMPTGTRDYTSNGDVKTYAFGNTFDLLNATTLLSDNTVSLSSVSFGRIPFQQLLIVTSRGNDPSSTPISQVPEPASLILIGTGLAALGMGMKRKKARK
jgi:PEP-CTERM motif